ncbi:PA14 domain-containing protein [Cellulophaga fucicola]|uniref:PA14 domain-containing protein n=1 Tax=Cellulophaga fucicola TaxID=76595 RepID=A0A1K1RBN2_9FLAO|nr:PA14 domain-containing protein [Cellulophaga fucicola]SFW69337.1 PA14 domain-containing protein [Cellulophaga fucicola]
MIKIVSKQFVTFLLLVVSLFSTSAMFGQCTDPSGIDTDGDGINDVCDFDDDNDGILDVDEGCGNLIINPSFEMQDFTDPAVFPNGFTDGSGTFIGATYNTNQLTGWNYTTNMDGWVGGGSPSWSPDVYADAYHGTQYVDVTGNNDVTSGVNNTLSQEVNTVVGVTYTVSFYWGEDIGHEAGTSVTLDIDIVDSGNTHIIDETLTYTAQGLVGGVRGPKQWFHFQRNFVATTTKTTIQFYATPDRTSNGAAIDLVSISRTQCLDSDSDGTPDALDLDSDADGCFDALEGDDNLGFLDLNGDGSISGSVDENGIPIAVNGGQAKGSSADYAVSSDLCDDDGDGVNNGNDKCPNFDDTIDSDNDGVPDGCDLDDDNDGILDFEENLSCKQYGVLEYEFYDLDVPGATTNNIPTSGALAEGRINNFNVNALQDLLDPGDSDFYAIRYNGYIRIDTEGTYTFYTNSDDGSRLFIDDTEVVNNDGDHGTQERSGTITLIPGEYKFKVLYFERRGLVTLDVRYKGPSITKQDVPFTILSSGNPIPSELVNNGDFKDWIFYDSWTASGNNWRTDAERAYYAQWNGTGTATFYQTINVTPNVANTIIFDVGSNAGFTGESTLVVKINGVSYFSETSTEIAANNGGNAQEGNATSNMATRSFTFIPSSSTVTLSFDGSSAINDHDSLYIDNVTQSKECEATDTDGDGIPDANDLDSDNDGCFDALEGNKNLDFSDLNSNGSISGTVDENGIPIAINGGQRKGSSTDYTITSDMCDDDGDGVNNLNDKCPYFDDAIDSDNDGVPDGCDVDDDNDGVSDCDESIDNVSNEFAWTLNNPSGNLEMDTNNDAKIKDWVLSDTETMILNGSQFNISASNIHIEPFTSQTKEEAVQNGDYIELSFTTGSDISSLALNRIRSGWYDTTRGDSYYTATAYTITGSSAWQTLSTDVFHTSDGSSYATFDHLASSPLYLKANTQYSFRFYVYGQIDDSSDLYSIFDDISFGFTACRSGNLDGDTNPNHLDDDSDGDGCNDADEAYADVTADADNNGMYGTGTPTVNLDGSVVGAAYTTPVDKDVNGSYDFLQVTTVPTITSQPGDQTVFVGNDAVFTVNGNNTDTFQWQVSTDGVNYVNIIDGVEYSGSQTSNLSVEKVSTEKNGYSYRVLVSNSSIICTVLTSNSALLFVKFKTVITNRRITYRIKKQ